MYKFLTLILAILILGCSEAEKIEQVIIPVAQLEVLQKAKAVESELLKLHQKREKQLKDLAL